MTKNLEHNLDNNLFIQSPFWKSRLENLSHPVALRMAQDLDASGPLGIGDGNNAFWKGFKHSYGTKDSNIDFLLRVKQQHPTKIALVQIGEFYETWGLDSLFLVEYCGINRMGRKGPRAGMPIANIQSVLDDLTDAGFSIVVCEQADDIHSRGRKTRFISEIITPSSPTYTYGLAMSHKANICFAEAPPEFGIAINSKGILMVEINPDLRTNLILEGLTIEAAIIRLNKYNGRLNRIFIHDKLPKELINAANLKFHNLVRISNYSSQNFANRVEELIKIDLGIDANIAFLKTKPLEVKNCPKPLYQGTAEQIGILPKKGIPNLVQLMLPIGSPATCGHIIKNILLNPPAAKYAKSLRNAIIELQENNQQLPTLIVSNPVRYIKTLNKKEANPEILKDLFSLAHIFLQCDKNLSPNFVENSLEIVSYLSSIKAKKDILNQSSNNIIAILENILPLKNDPLYLPKSDLIPHTLFERIEEEFRGRISRDANSKISNLYKKVEKAAQKYEAILDKTFSAILKCHQESNNKSKKTSKRLALSYDIHNHAIWILGNLNSEIITKFNLIHPLDRYNKLVKERLSTQEVEDALNNYKNAANQTYDAIKIILKETSKKLAPLALPIIHLASFSNLSKTLYLHIKESKPKNWTINFNCNNDNNSTTISLNGFFPYWMQSNNAITNCLDFDNSCLLTGHNMSGKSTLIRSLATTTLLASSGFMFPAQNVTINNAIDAWFVRTGASDDPEAGLSSFAVEMMEIKAALRDASSSSFLLIDELGKGTESKAGHAIAASVLEYLATNNIRSIFATHWHEIFANKSVNLKNIKLLRMLCDGDDVSYKVVEGVDLNSAAFKTAAKIGIATNIIERAQEIAKNYDQFALSQLTNNAANDIISNFYDKTNYIDLAKETLSKLTKEKITNIKNLQGNEMPALNNVGLTIIYILKTSNNFFYVGETDNFYNRVQSHRHRLQDKNCQFFYIAIKNGKSQARQIEQELITKLKNNGLPMLSIGDSTNLNFGAS